MAPGTNAKIEELQFRVKTDPKSRLFFPLAEELRKNGRLADAEQVLRTGLGVHGTYLSAWVSLGRVLREEKKHTDAVDALSKALQLDPGNVVAARLLADTYFELGEKVEAIKKYKLVHALLPADEELEARIDALDREIRGEQEPEPVTVAPAEAAPELAAQPEPLPEPMPQPEPEPMPEPAPEPPLAAIEENPFAEPEPAMEETADVFAPADAAVVEAADDDLTATTTMADLYVRQGLIAEARRIYEHILQKNPDDESVRANLAALDDAPAADVPRRRAEDITEPEPLPAPEPFAEPESVAEPEPIAEPAAAPARNPKIVVLEQWLAKVSRHA